MKKSTIYFSILLVLALCCAQFAAASIVFKDSVVVSAGQRDSVPSGATWMVDYVRVEYGGTLEVQSGARKLFRDGQLYIILHDGTLYDARGALVD